jgi:peptidoglycan/LPS O-acetylase OafA/YrhL
MGLFFSMTKDSNPLRFYIKRLKRVLIPYAIWGGVFWIIRDLLIDNTSVARFLYDFSFLSFLTEGEKVIWYIFFIAVMYLVFPLIFKVLSVKRNAFIAFLTMLCVGVAIPVVVRFISPSLYENIEVAVSRIPIFILGAYYGKRIYNHETLKIGDIILVILGIVFHIYSVLSRYEIIPTGTGLFRYEFALFSISLVFIFVWLFSKVKWKPLHSFLKSVGAISLEFYMTHVTIDNLMRFCKIPTYEIWYYILCVILSIIFSFLLHFALKNIIIKVGKT